MPYDPILSRLDQITRWLGAGEITSNQYHNLMDALAHTANAPRPNCANGCGRVADVFDEDTIGHPPLCAACWMAQHGRAVLP